MAQILGAVSVAIHQLQVSLLAQSTKSTFSGLESRSRPERLVFESAATANSVAMYSMPNSSSHGDLAGPVRPSVPPPDHCSQRLSAGRLLSDTKRARDDLAIAFGEDPHGEGSGNALSPFSTALDRTTPACNEESPIAYRKSHLPSEERTTSMDGISQGIVR